MHIKEFFEVEHVFDDSEHHILPTLKQNKIIIENIAVDNLDMMPLSTYFKPYKYITMRAKLKNLIISHECYVIYRDKHGYYRFNGWSARLRINIENAPRMFNLDVMIAANSKNLSTLIKLSI